MNVVIITTAILAILVVGVVVMYNRLVVLKNRFKNFFAQIDVQLQRRYDLIPNVVEMARGYMKHERETLEAVIAARNQASTAVRRASADPTAAGALQQLIAADSSLNTVLSRLFALVEAYPDLKANQNMMQVHEELASTENRIAFSRQAFNDAVMQYNTCREQFPVNLVANMFQFSEAALFEVQTSAARQAPQVSFT